MCIRDRYNTYRIWGTSVREKEDDTGAAPHDFAVLTDVSLLQFVYMSPATLDFFQIRLGRLTVSGMGDFQHRPYLQFVFGKPYQIAEALVCLLYTSRCV